MKRQLLILFTMLVCSISYGQIIHVVGTKDYTGGGGSPQENTGASTIDGSYSQMIYLQGEVPADTLFGIQFESLGGGNSILGGIETWEVWVGETAQDNLSSTTVNNYVKTGMVKVFDGLIDIRDDKTTIYFDNYFIYTGTQNLVVSVIDKSDQPLSPNWRKSLIGNTPLSKTVKFNAPGNITPANAPNGPYNIMSAFGEYGRAYTEFILSEPCETPTNLIASNIGATSATIDFDALNGNSWNVYFREYPNGATNSTPIVVSTNSVTLNGLSKRTEYEVIIESNCGPTIGNSFNRATIQFNTLACDVMSTLPVQSFEGGNYFTYFDNNCWYETGAVDNRLVEYDVGDGNNGSDGFLDIAPDIFTGSFNEGFVALPKLDNFTNKELSFWFKRSNSVGFMSVGFMSDIHDITSYTQIMSLDPTGSNGWTNITIDLNQHSIHEDGFIAFSVAGNSSVAFFLDDISVTRAPDITIFETVCTGSSYIFPDGSSQNNITADLSQTSTVTASTGLDSIILTELTVVAQFNVTEDVSVCFADNYSFPDGSVQNIIAPISYTSNLTTLSGCDSIIVTNVAVLQSYNVANNVSICSGDDYTFADGTTQTNITSQTVYVSNLQSTDGCDSNLTTTIDVFTASSETENISVCLGDSYTFPDGSMQSNITSQVVYTSNLQSTFGCDSTIITTVNVAPNYTNLTENATVCNGGSYTFPDGTSQSNITTNTNYVSSLTSSIGCDSVITTTITVTAAYNISESATICSGENYTFADGSTQTNITADLVQTSTLPSTIGCDSNIITTITVNPTYNTTESIELCSGSHYTWPDGSTTNNITTAGFNLSILQTTAGCDSVIRTNFAILPVYNSTTLASVCAGDNYTFPDGSVQQNLQANVTQTSSLQTNSGCDSIIVTTVNVNPNYSSTDNIDICSGADYTFPDGTSQNNITNDVTYTSNLQSSAGCDSIIVTTLTVITSFNMSTSITVCSGISYTFPDGTSQVITSQTTQTSTVQSSLGCDSIINTTINVNPIYNQAESATICSGGNYTFPDGSTQNNITSPVVYTSNLQTTEGCDSTIVTTINVNPVYNSTAQVSICSGDDYTWPDGTTTNNLTADGFNISILQSNDGCDSIIRTNFSVIQPYNLTETVIICEGASYTFPDGSIQNNITSQVIYTSNLQTALLGCDSVIVTTVNIGQSYNLTESVSICNGASYTFPDGSVQNNISSDFTYTSNLQTAGTGCDSIIETIVNVLPSYNLTESVSVCNGASYTFPDGSVINNVIQSTQYSSNLTTAAGCDSIITTMLTVTDIDESTTLIGNTLSANQTGATYQWIDCNGTFNIAGETSMTFEPTISGNYAVEITINGCTETSPCTIITITGIFDQATIDMSVYPNPTTDILNIETTEQIDNIIIYNSSGKVIKESFGHIEMIKVADLPSGMYFIAINSKNGSANRLFMKE